MKTRSFTRWSLCALGVLALAAGAFAQTQQPSETFQPTVGQAGKDVVWVPSPQPLVEQMLDLAKITPSDYLIDLGSGDGRTVITAAKRGARAMGIEYNPDMVALSTRNAASERVSDRARFVKADLFESDFSQATVITMFLLPDINLRLRPRLLELKPGTRLVSNTFTMGDWTPDERATVDDCDAFCTALFWIVPAKAEGTWRLPQGQFTLTQTFQMLSGTMTSGGSTVPITEGRLRGDGIEIRVGDAQYSGRVAGDAIQGTVTAGSRSSAWSMTRQK